MLLRQKSSMMHLLGQYEEVFLGKGNALSPQEALAQFCIFTTFSFLSTMLYSHFL